jgi:hypothetical protein
LYDTVEPLSAFAFALGLCEMTVVSCPDDGPDTHVPAALKPAPVNAASASVVVSEVTDGTVT